FSTVARACRVRARRACARGVGPIISVPPGSQVLRPDRGGPLPTVGTRGRRCHRGVAHAPPTPLERRGNSRVWVISLILLPVSRPPRPLLTARSMCWSLHLLPPCATTRPAVISHLAARERADSPTPRVGPGSCRLTGAGPCRCGPVARPRVSRRGWTGVSPVG